MGKEAPECGTARKTVVLRAGSGEKVHGAEETQQHGNTALTPHDAVSWTLKEMFRMFKGIKERTGSLLRELDIFGKKSMDI